MRIRTRRPRFGDPVALGQNRYTVIATTVAPTRGYWLRPVGAADASHDRFLPLADRSELRWNTGKQVWERCAV